ncbi:MAG: beta-methylgalactoside transporter [Oscillospiraceae bacterium]|jgi:methyl-galactoside transport system permease protein|nr:beta-methylgalactoside transporter [Oscillospiraceae bacterium]
MSKRFDGYRALDARSKRIWWGDFFVRNAIYIIIVLLVIYVQVYSMSGSFNNTFLSFKSIIDIVKRAGSSLFLALGVGGIIVLTGTDLSAGRIMGLTACLAASLLQNPVEEYASKMFPDLATPPIILILLLVMAFGGAVGALNGFCVAKFKLHPFIVTLATQLMLYGAVLMYVQLGTNGGGPISGLTEEYKNAVKGTVNVGGTAIPYYVFYAVLAAALMWFIWNRTTLGKNMYAVGANPEAANVSGVSVMTTTILVFMMAGILYGFSGFIEAARVGSNGPTTGVNAELDAIAACVIGGVSFTGGTGKISGIVTGVILLEIISVALQWLGVSSDLQYIIKGLIILVAVALDMRKYLAKK